jgi:hypothetical protein
MMAPYKKAYNSDLAAKLVLDITSFDGIWSILANDLKEVLQLLNFMLSNISP